MESFYQASHQATGGRVPIFHHIFPTTLANSSTILKILVLAVEFEIFQKLKGCIIAHLKDHTVDLFFLYTILQKHYNGLQKPQEMLELSQATLETEMVHLIRIQTFLRGVTRGSKI